MPEMAIAVEKHSHHRGTETRRNTQSNAKPERTEVAEATEEYKEVCFSDSI
jgi:hypothetical protein